MNPVVGLDVAKGESQIQAFLDRKTPFKRSFKILHTVEGFEQLLQFLKSIEEIANTKPVLNNGINRALPFSSYAVLR